MTENNSLNPIFKEGVLETEEQTLALEKKAQEVIASLQETFLNGAKESLTRALQILNSVRNESAQQKNTLMQELLYPIAHDLKGQGNVFGYPLLTELGSLLCTRIKKTSDWTNDALNACEYDILDMQSVLSFKPDTYNQKLDQIKMRLKAIKP